MISALKALLRSHDGPMTSELVLKPSQFGLGKVPNRLKPAATTTSVCGFCSTGCFLKIHLNEQGEAINLSADEDNSVNLGMACPKGWEALTPLAAPDRATHPLLRNSSGEFEKVDWAVAMETFVRRFKGIQQKYGKASVAVLSTGQIVMEEMGLLGAVAKFGMGLLHIDSNTRQCMATSHVAYKQSFGFDAPPFTYRDFEESDALIFIGANPCIAHPIMWQRVMMNRRDPEIVVIDPRRTETAMAATFHVPLQPKSDLVLLYGIAHLLIERGAVKQDFIEQHCTGFSEFSAFLRAFTPQRVCLETGLPRATLERLVKIITERERVSFWWTMGVNQGHESTRTAQAVINLALMTGNIGRPGTGANSITGQCNAMGSRLFGNATSLLGGYNFSDRGHRLHVAEILGLDAACIPDRPGLAYDQIIDGIELGKIRGLWIIATNPVHSWIDHKRFNALRANLDFLVVQDMYTTTETAQVADLILPAAGWGEKEGVLINSERRLGLVKKVSRAPGQALTDFSIFKLVADAWGCGEQFRDWSSPEAAFQILKNLSRGQPCDFSGIRDYAHLEEARGIQWPYTQLAPQDLRPADRRLFEDGKFFTEDGRAKFFFDEPRPSPEPTDFEYPFVLLTGRGSSAQWHTGTRTNKSDVLRKLAPKVLYLEINPTDVARLQLKAGQIVSVTSRRGAASATILPTSTVQPGQVFLPMHFDAVNRLTFPAFDPHSRQPSYKACAVKIVA